MDGVLYARNATTGAPLWSFQTGGPIRHSAGVAGTILIVSSYDGNTYALNTANGSLLWQVAAGSSATAPLIDAGRLRVFVASTSGVLTGLDLQSGDRLWSYDSGAPILTSPSLSSDGNLVFFANESIKAIAVDAASGAVRWQTGLQGQTMTERYPVVSGNTVLYRSQPIYFFHNLLRGWGDDIMDQAGGVLADWTADWNAVKPKILSFLNSTPSAQTFFALNATTGTSLGTLPVLYTYGNNDVPNVPVVSNGQIYVTYRARHGIQTDSGTVHVTTKYDAELGKLNLSTLDITALRAATNMAGTPQFRMTSDEPAMLSMGGDILWVDNWERLGGINTRTGQLIYSSTVSNDWPECSSQCGPGGSNAFFPMSGKPSDPAYPFPAPRVGEGRSRSGLVIANSMLYWKVIEGGLGAIAHDPDGVCATPLTWQDQLQDPLSAWQLNPNVNANRAFAEYVTTDLTRPVANPPQSLVDRVRSEVGAFLAAAGSNHMVPYYLERGMSSETIWPYNTSPDKTGIPIIQYGSHGNAFWQDPGELLYTMAMAYPYLDASLQSNLKTYMAAEMVRYPPLKDLPYEDSGHDWLRSGAQRERYSVPFRNQLAYWPPPSVNYSVLYSLWLWSRNINDWSYATAHWSDIQALANTLGGASKVRYYADLAGSIGYARLAQQIKGSGSAEYTNGLNSAVSAMQASLNFAAFRDRAASDYLDPRDQATGWYAPVFYGIVPEVGLFLREKLQNQAQTYLASLEGYNSSGVGLVWWYLTQVGAHAENGETSFELPFAAWSHFLAHAYILQEPQSALVRYLDRPWAPGDLYSIQKLVSAIQAP